MIELLAIVILLIFLFNARTSTDRRLGALESELARLRAQLGALEPGAKPVADAPPALEAPAAPHQDTAAVPDLQAAAPALVSGHGLGAEDRAPPPASAGDREPVRSRSIESILGGNWAVWIGGIALALGGILMARYAIETGLVSPGVRLAIAALFGLSLVALGEAARRRAMPERLSALSAGLNQSVMIPGILTAAGGVTLFASIYAAHQLYGFIGPAITFLLLAVVALGILALSLLHGQALAGLGLLGALATPALVIPAAEADIPVLMTYVTVVWFGAMIASRMRSWIWVPVAATLGAGGWAALAAIGPAATAPVLAFLFLTAGAWLLTPDLPVTGLAGSVGTGRQATTGRLANQGLWLCLSISALSAMTLFFSRPDLLAGGHLPYEGLVILVALVLALTRRRDSLAAMVAVVIMSTLAVLGSLALYDGLSTEFGVPAQLSGTVLSVVVGAILLFGGAIALSLGRHRGVASERIFSAAALSPLLLAALSYVDHGNWHFDAIHAAFAAATSVALLALADHLVRRRFQGLAMLTEMMLTGGAFLALALAIFMVTDGVWLVILWSLAGLGFFLAAGLRLRASLPWMAVLSVLIIMARMAWDPTLVGQDALSPVPVFNQLLPGYGIPAVITAFAAWRSRRMDDRRLTRVLEGLAMLLSFLVIAVLVRHGMHQGRLSGGIPTLGEQSIYTLLLIGFSGLMLQLDRRDANPLFAHGSMIVAILSMLAILNLHLLALNPYVSGELVGDWPLLNLLLPGYLLPGLAYGALARLAQGRRPAAFVLALGVTALVLCLAWLTLSVRQLWQGSSIVDWQGFLEGETYSYSLAWLGAGVGLLALGARLRAVSLRYASAAVVMLTVVKVFLFDLSNLEGLLRALSFIGLGFVLIGIGLFYQRLLLRTRQEGQS